MLISKSTRKRVFLDESNLVVPWIELIVLIGLYAHRGKYGRLPFAAANMCCIHLPQLWVGLFNPVTKETPHDFPFHCEFAFMGRHMGRLPYESTDLMFRHFREDSNLSMQLLATLKASLAASISA